MWHDPTELCAHADVLVNVYMYMTCDIYKYMYIPYDMMYVCVYMTDNRCLESKKKIEHIELPAKLLDYVLWSNKSNINQYMIQGRLYT